MITCSESWKVRTTLDIERFWLRSVVAGERLEDSDDAWKVPPNVPAEAVFAAYRDEIDRAKAITGSQGR